MYLYVLDCMRGNILEHMCDGIIRSSLALIFITQSYHDKVSSHNAYDNCKKEFEFIERQKTSDYMIPIVMEMCMLNPRSWSGMVGMILGGHLYVDMCTDDNIDVKVNLLCESIKKKVRLIKETQCMFRCSSSADLEVDEYEDDCK